MDLVVMLATVPDMCENTPVTTSCLPWFDRPDLPNMVIKDCQKLFGFCPSTIRPARNTLHTTQARNHKSIHAQLKSTKPNNEVTCTSRHYSYLKSYWILQLGFIWYSKCSTHAMVYCEDGGLNKVLPSPCVRTTGSLARSSGTADSSTTVV